ncbi:GNAT family N-acetyltransferase [Paenibacillus pini]|uniref:N-acetyltransferase domain-containing protein n=1 Tax=Paenibacillus pini JCM 16418 TaxID=1236976 RepID=W7YU53_9BACL|nr:GNAT family N-acetyltransferase [Paenibacillus pini]GAF08101.1 hypothetical protein JCM16418_2139 [Paenibacillus pini JCM 16418]
MDYSQEVIVREAYEHEQEAIANVILDAYGQYATILPEQRWIDYQDSIRKSVYGDGPEARIVAVIQDKIVGSAQLFRSSETAYGHSGIQSPVIRLLAVASDVRGKGIATLLIQDAARRSLTLGATTLNLHTSDMMASAVKLYERLGFERAFDTDVHNGDVLVKGYCLNLLETPLLSGVV